MTHTRDKAAPTGQGYNFMGPRAIALQTTLERVERENLRRVPCSICTLRILPENMEKHIRQVHEED